MEKTAVRECIILKLYTMEEFKSVLSRVYIDAPILFYSVYEESKNHPDLVRSAICGVVIAFTLIIVLSYFPGEPVDFSNCTLDVGSDLDPMGGALKLAAKGEITEEDEKTAEKKIVHSKKLQKLLGMTGFMIVPLFTSSMRLCVYNISFIRNVS